MIDDRGQRLATLICKGADDIWDIRASGAEFYFDFNGKIFSLRRSDDGTFSLFAYPRWVAHINFLITNLEHGSDDPDATFAPIHAERDGTLSLLFKKLQERYLGLDNLYAEFGIE